RSQPGLSPRSPGHIWQGRRPAALQARSLVATRWISAMRTSRPTARPAHPFSHFIESDFYAAVPGLVFPGGCDPAYPLIARQWGNARPYIRDNCVGFDRPAKIWRHPVHCTGSDRLSSHSNGLSPIQSYWYSASFADVVTYPKVFGMITSGG